MSTSLETGTSSSIAGGHAQAPRLQGTSVGYAAWKPNMNVYLQRNGAEGIHCKPMTAERWSSMNTQVESWAEEELDAAMALLSPVTSTDGSSSSTATTKETATKKSDGSAQQVADAVKAARKVIAQTVERSRKVYGIIYAALPEELRAQVAHVSQGFAYGLWLWLETKFQSTEEDHVSDLLESWSSLHQDIGESFDAYRARVNELRALLVAADEPPSARMYTQTLTGRLLPMYKQAVLALKVGNKFKDAKAIDWNEITALINAHERNTNDESTGRQAAMAASGQRMRSPPGEHAPIGKEESNAPKCFECGQSGHKARRCPSRSRHQPSRQGPTAAVDRDGESKKGKRSAMKRQNTAARKQERAAAAVEFDVTDSSTDDSETEARSSKGAGKQKTQHRSYVLTYASVLSRTLASPNPARKTKVPQGIAASPDPATAAKMVVVGENAPTPSIQVGIAAKTDSSDEFTVVRDHTVTKDASGVLMEIPSHAATPSSTSRNYYSSLSEIEAPSTSATTSAPRTEPVETVALSLPAAALTASRKSKKSRHHDHAAWGVDSMASLHCSGNKALFSNLKECDPVEVTVANHEIVTPMHCGTVNILVATSSGRKIIIQIHDVYYHESFAANLLSSNVLNEMGWGFHCTKETSYLKTPGGNKIRLSTEGRVSMIKSGRGTVYALGSIVSGKVKDLMHLHKKLGHVPFSCMHRALKSGKVLDVTSLHFDQQTLDQAKKLITECPSCTAGRVTRSWLGERGLDKGTKPLEAMHMDTYFVTLEDGDRKWIEYGVTMSDPHSAWRYHSAVSSKDAIANEVIAAIEHAKTQFDRRIKRLYTDGGSEFINQTLKDYCRRHGIELKYAPARSPQLNGIAERSVRSCKDAIRTLLAASRVPWRFWTYAASHATFLWNRTTICKRTGVTPYESLYGKPPSAKHWGIFGCNAWLHIPKEQRSSLASKTEPCIYLGHSSTQNCASVYVLRTRKVIQSRDVTYRPESFTLARAVIKGDVAVEKAIAEFGGLNADDESDSQSNHEDASMEDVNNDGRLSDTVESDTEFDASANQRWNLDAITDQRWYGRQREHQYRCAWSGDYDATWEPAEQIRKDAPQAVDRFLATLPPPRVTRRTPRGDRQDTESSESLEAKADDIDGSTDPNPPTEDELDDSKVHMVMSAMRMMHAPSIQVSNDDHDALLFAVKAGIARLESQTPETYRQAINCRDANKWKAAMDMEIDSCIAKGVWEEVRIKDLPTGANVLPCKWVYKVKVDETGAAIQHKARLTPKGFRQKEGKDYFEVFARTGMYKTMRFGLSLAAKWDHELEQLDVPTAFLNADLDEDVFMQFPEGYREGKDGLVLHLKKSLYGLKQSPRNWYLRVSAFILERLGFKATVSDPCLFWKRSRTGRLMLIYLFVDDFQASFHRDDREEWNDSKHQLVKEFNTKDMGESKWMLGMRITRDRKARTITLDQEVYVSKALEKYGYSECTTRPTPEVVGAAHQEPTEDQRKPADRQRYMEITGTLMYAAISTRLDIAHAVFYLASHMLAPTQQHMAAADRVMRYLASTRGLGLTFGTRNGGALGDSRGQTRTQVDVCAYADADWANSRGDRRSITGWVSKINGDPISWASKKQRTVALSTCEAELYSEAAAIQEVLWLRGLLKELGLQSHVGSEVFGDNQSAIAVSKNGVKGERTKHVDVKYHFVTETVERGDVRLKWIPTAEQQADIFTKALPQPSFELLRSQLMMY